jgi:hypothetical protein
MSPLLYSVYRARASMGKEQAYEDYQQPTLEGLKVPETEETELANCLVLAAPHYSATDKRKEWKCSIYAQPSIFQPDIDARFLATATNDVALEARRSSLEPGDRAVMKGVVSSQTIQLANGSTETINTIALSAITIISREKRVSTTVYEQKQKHKSLKSR